MTDTAFTEAQQRGLCCVLDEIVPPSDTAKLPGAGEVGLVEYIETALEKSPELRPVIVAGLSAIDAIAADRGASNFAELPAAQRRSVIEEITAAHPGFLPSLIFHTYVGYYQQPEVVAALGVESHPPFPKGFDLEVGDLSLLDVVKQRPKMYREV